MADSQSTSVDEAADAAALGAGLPEVPARDDGASESPAADSSMAAKPSPTASAKPIGQRLPAYSRSLLKIPVSVSVTLASKKAPLAHIVSLAPGSIIQFDKSCEDLLELCVGQRAVADGEAVKVGDKFGLRINSIILPKERFHRVAPGRAKASLDVDT
jgi:flagellar motor switch protein FliN